MSARGAGSSPPNESRAVRVARLEEISRRTRDIRTHLPQCGEIVEYPERAPVGCGDEIAFLDRKIVDRHDRQIALERLPACAGIERHPDPALGPRVQQTPALGIFAHDSREFRCWDAGGDQRPRRAVVIRPVQIRLEIVELVAIRGQIRCARRKVRRINHRDASPLRQSGGSHVLPRPAGVAGNLHESVVRSGPDHSSGSR